MKDEFWDTQPHYGGATGKYPHTLYFYVVETALGAGKPDTKIFGRPLQSHS